MLIILEGIDKAGKSTLAKTLSDISNKPVSINHFMVPKNNEDAKKMYIEFANKVKGDRDNIYIADRLHLGELVYGPIKRNYTPNEDYMAEVEDKLMEAGVLLVLVSAPEKVIAKRFKTEKEDYSKLNEIPVILSLFQAAYDLSKLPKMQVIGTGSPIENALMILEKAQEVEHE